MIAYLISHFLNYLLSMESHFILRKVRIKNTKYIDATPTIKHITDFINLFQWYLKIYKATHVPKSILIMYKNCIQSLILSDQEVFSFIIKRKCETHLKTSRFGSNIDTLLRISIAVTFCNHEAAYSFPSSLSEDDIRTTKKVMKGTFLSFSFLLWW